MKKITKKTVERFCEDNFLDDGLDALMTEVSKMTNAKAEVIEKGDKALLRIEIFLEEM